MCANTMLQSTYNWTSEQIHPKVRMLKFITVELEKSLNKCGLFGRVPGQIWNSLGVVIWACFIDTGPGQSLS